MREREWEGEKEIIVKREGERCGRRDSGRDNETGEISAWRKSAFTQTLPKIT